MSRRELQRVFLCAALARNASVLVLDSPETSLDVEYSYLLMQTLKKQAKEGKTVIVSLHDRGLAINCCDELIVLDAGREIYRGTPEKLREEKILQRVFRIDLPI